VELEELPRLLEDTSFRRLITVSKIDSLRKPALGKMSKNFRNIESMKPILIGSV